MEALNQDNAALINAEQLLKKTGIDVGDTVADLGVGRAADFVIAAGKIVKDTGMVYAVDVVKGVLDIVNTRVKSAGLHNVITVWSDLEVYGGARRILDSSLDLAMLSDTLCQSKKHGAIFRETVRMMKPGARLLVVEWKPVHTAIGPPVDHRVGPDAVRILAQEAGLSVEEEFEAGEYHWGMICKK